MKRTWTWVNSRRWWRTGRSSILQSMGSQNVGYNLATEQQRTWRERDRSKDIKATKQTSIRAIITSLNFANFYMKPLLFFMEPKMSLTSALCVTTKHFRSVSKASLVVQLRVCLQWGDIRFYPWHRRISHATGQLSPLPTTEPAFHSLCSTREATIISPCTSLQLEKACA